MSNRRKLKVSTGSGFQRRAAHPELSPTFIPVAVGRASSARQPSGQVAGQPQGYRARRRARRAGQSRRTSR